MCITRVGKVLQVEQSHATVRFFDGGSSPDVDISVVGAEKGSYVEVYGNLALSLLTAGQARARMTAWDAVRKGMP
jgi:hydrogenase maturation factor